MSENRDQQHISFVSAVMADAKTQNLTQATREVFHQTELLKRTAAQYRNGADVIHQGRAFEILEVMKFNRDAATKGSALRASTTAANGSPTDAVDIVVTEGTKVLREFQAKCCHDSANSLHALSDLKYGEMGRLLPKEQEAKARQLAGLRIAKGTLKAADYQKTLKNLHGELSHGTVHSGGTTWKESLSAFNNPRSTALLHDLSAAGTEMTAAGMEGGATSAGITAGLAGTKGVYRLIKGEDPMGAVLAEITADTAKSFATGYATSALGKGVGHVAEQVGLGGMAKCNAHVAIAAGIVQSGKSLVRYLNDEIDEEQMLAEVSHTVITGTASFYYGALGQIAIPIPVVGAVIGSTVGYFVGNILYQSGLLSLGDTVGVKQAKERRQRIEALCLQSVPLMQRHREELQALMQEHFTGQAAVFDSAFDSMESAMAAWNPDDCLVHLERICTVFDTGLPFKNFEEFDQFMADDSTTFEL